MSSQFQVNQFSNINESDYESDNSVNSTGVVNYKSNMLTCYDSDNTEDSEIVSEENDTQINYFTSYDSDNEENTKKKLKEQKLKEQFEKEQNEKNQKEKNQKEEKVKKKKSSKKSSKK